MATTVTVLRRLIDEPDQDGTYTDAELTQRLSDAQGDANVVARDVWAEKMAGFSTLVDISEGGSQRKASQAYDHAKEMWTHFNALASTEPGVAPAVIRRITRV